MPAYSNYYQSNLPYFAFYQGSYYTYYIKEGISYNLFRTIEECLFPTTYISSLTTNFFLFLDNKLYNNLLKAYYTTTKAIRVVEAINIYIYKLEEKGKYIVYYKEILD